MLTRFLGGGQFLILFTKGYKLRASTATLAHFQSAEGGDGRGRKRPAWEARLAFTEVCPLAFWALPCVYPLPPLLVPSAPRFPATPPSLAPSTHFLEAAHGVCFAVARTAGERSGLEAPPASGGCTGGSPVTEPPWSQLLLLPLPRQTPSSFVEESSRPESRQDSVEGAIPLKRTKIESAISKYHHEARTTFCHHSTHD